MEVAMNHDDQNSCDRENESLKDFEAKQAHELATFEAEQARALEKFEEKEIKELETFEAERHHRFDIKIDRTFYIVHKEYLTGEEIRHVPEVPIGQDRDLFEVKPGGSDVKILNDTIVKIHDGLRFFTAPAQINPGAGECPRHVAR
jgi:hypothetical protein